MPSLEAAKDAWRALRDHYPTRQERQPKESITYYDTFDWRLHRAGVTLLGTPHRQGRQLVLSRGNGEVVQRLTVSSPPGFAGDLPAGRLRDEVGPLLEMRRLLPTVSLETSGQTLHLLDDERKTVVRVHLRQGTARTYDLGGEVEATASSLPVTLQVQHLRGFDTELDGVAAFFRGELGLEPSEHDELAAALAAVGRRPGDYSSKLQLDLDPGERADVATAKIHKTLLATLLANEDGTRRDLDSEFLHDFRVAVRRTRSALTQIRGVFPPRLVERFKKEFSWLGSITGPCRDLDVYLLKIDDYEASLPEEVRPHLEPLRDFLASEKQKELRRLVRRLDSRRYEKLVEAWSAFLDEVSSREVDVDEEMDNAARPIRDVGRERIRRAYDRILKKGRRITPDSPAEPLHRLRIDAKKLRYLLEFFKGLHPEGEVRPLIRSLKRLQDNLGDFNDYEVQQHKLGEIAHEMHEKGKASVDTLLALGELVAGLRRGQAGERERFQERFAAFDEPDNRAAYEKLFGC